MLEEYRKLDRVILVRHDKYWRGKPTLERVEVLIMPEHETRTIALEKGDVHFISGRRAQWWVKNLRAKEGIAVDVISPGCMLVLHLNLTRKPLQDIRVRQAIAHAISREGITEVVGKDITIKVCSVVPPEHLGYTENVLKYDYDPDFAKLLLAKAGYPHGFNLGEVVMSPIEVFRVPMEVIQDQLAKVGIKFDLKVLDHASYHSMIRKDVNPLVIYCGARTPTADPFLTQWYHSDSIVGKPTAVTNFSHYGEAIPGVDVLVDLARVEPDPKKQLELWNAAQRLISADLPGIPLYVQMWVIARRTNVYLGYEPEELHSTMLPVYPVYWNAKILKE